MLPSSHPPVIGNQHAWCFHCRPISWHDKLSYGKTNDDQNNETLDYYYYVAIVCLCLSQRCIQWKIGRRELNKVSRNHWMREGNAIFILYIRAYTSLCGAYFSLNFSFVWYLFVKIENISTIPRHIIRQILHQKCMCKWIQSIWCFCRCSVFWWWLPTDRRSTEMWWITFRLASIWLGKCLVNQSAVINKICRTFLAVMCVFYIVDCL